MGDRTKRRRQNNILSAHFPAALHLLIPNNRRSAFRRNNYIKKCQPRCFSHINTYSKTEAFLVPVRFCVLKALRRLCTNLCNTWYILALGLVCQCLNCRLLKAGTRLSKVEGLGENRWKMNEQRMSARGGNRWYLQPHHLFSSVYPLSLLTSFFQELPGLLCPHHYHKFMP